jgi:hypothetical protein
MDAGKQSQTISASIDDANMKNIKTAVAIGIFLLIGMVVGYYLTKTGVFM